MARTTAPKVNSLDDGSGPRQQIITTKRYKHGLHLSFENTVQNRTLPPCDLNGFMDYLYYVERRAENLQFFLWYCDYVERWSRLSPRLRQLAPAWGPNGPAEAAQSSTTLSTAATLSVSTVPATIPAKPAPVHAPNQVAISRGMSTRASPKGNRHGLSIDTSHISTFATMAATDRRKRTEGGAAAAASAEAAAAAAAAAHSIYTRTTTHTTSATVPHRTRSASSRLAASIHQRSDSAKLTHILAILEDADAEDRARAAVAAAAAGPSSSSSSPPPPSSQTSTRAYTNHHVSQASSVSSSYSTTSSDSPSTALGTASSSAQPQPFRAEFDRIVQHYIAAQGPRALPDFFGPERAACLRAATRTTHPSALLPAFLAAEAALRTQSFPRFAHRHCVGNAGGARLALATILSVVALVLGAVVLALIVLLGNTPTRIVCLAMWWPAGVTLLLALRPRVDVVLHLQGRRMLHPWEREDEDDEDETDLDADTDLEKGGPHHGRHPSTASSASSASSSALRLDPLRKPSLQPLGPRNDPDAEPWAIRAAQRSLYHRVLGELGWRRTASSSSPPKTSPRTVAVQNRGVRALQDRAVLTAVLWAGLVSTVVMVGSLFIPSPTFV